MKRVLTLFWVAFFNVICLPALAQQPSETAAKQRTLVFLGDSLTAGYNLPSGEAFPAHIQQKLAGSGLTQWKVVNVGVSGDTTAGGLARLDWVLRANPNIVFLCLGANDGLRGVKPEETEKNLKAIIEKIQAKNSKVILAGMHLPENYGPDYRKAFSAIFPKLAKQHNLPFMPFLLDKVAMKQDLVMYDGMHPNAKGTRLIADNVWKVIEPVVREVSLAK